jgi:sodium transport system permease protein
VSDQPLPPPLETPSTRPKVRHVVRLWRLTRKELRETLRDRRTIITLVLMPLLVYPLLSVAFRQFFFSSSIKPTDIEWRIAGDSEETLQGFYRQLEFGGGVIENIDGKEETKPKLKLFPYRMLEEAVRTGEADLAVRAQFVQAPGLPDGVQIEYELIYQPDSPLGRTVVEYAERRLWAFDRISYSDRLRQQSKEGAPHTIWKRRPIAGVTGEVVSMAALVPLILILMTITGAVYPAIDLTAGERERGTLESLMAAPLPRLSMLLAKYFAVLAVALLTAGANLLGMSVTVYSTGLGPMLFGENGLTPAAILIILSLLVLFAAFFSALLLAVTSFARSFKEAQAYLIPFMLLAIAPGFLSVMPGIELSSMLAVVPLVNIVLLARDVLQGTTQPMLAFAAVVSTSLYGVAALALAARIFGSDAILYGSQGSWADLFRRPDELYAQPSLAGAALCAAVVFALQNVLSGLLALGTASLPLETRLLLSAVLTGVLYLLIPLGIARMQFVSLPRGFQLRVGPLLAYVGALGLGLSLWAFAHEIVLLTQQLSWMNVDLKKLASAEIFEKIKQLSPLLLVGTTAIAPAICEEWFFRGYLLGSLRGRLPGWAAIAATGILFGLFHVFVSGGPGGVRLLPSTLLGLVLGWICWRTKSIFPGILLHATHNGLLLLVGRYQDELAKVGFGVQEQEHLPRLWLVVAACGVMLGVGLIWLGTRSRSAR